MSFRAMKEDLEQAGRMEIASALLAGLGCFSSILAASWAVLSEDRQFAVIPFSMFALFLGATAILYMAYAFGFQTPPRGPDQVNRVAAEVDIMYSSNEETDQTSEPDDTEYRQTLLEQRCRFYDFIYGCVTQGKFGEGTWTAQGLPAKTYRTWDKILRDYGIVSLLPDGKRKVHMTFNEALTEIASHTNDPANYWTEVLENYHLKINPKRPSPPLSLEAEGA